MISAATDQTGGVTSVQQRRLRRTNISLGFLMKCRKKVEIQVARFVKMKNGKPATEGVCPDCDTKVFRIGKGWRTLPRYYRGLFHHVAVDLSQCGVYEREVQYAS